MCYSSLRLNPLKRVNSILTLSPIPEEEENWWESQSPQTGQFNSYRADGTQIESSKGYVSIPSSGSIQFLRYGRLYSSVL